MITLDHVTYTYPGAARPTITDLSLVIEEGEFVVVCGPSGAGKSTFLRLLNGLVPHFYGGTIGGDVQVWGRSIRSHQPRDLADLVGFVFQNPEAQFVVDLVEDELAFGMENLGLAPRLMRRRIEEVLDQLGIAHLRRRHVSTLSGGEQQRVAIAAVLAAQPRALVLDEPTSQLDPHAAEEVLTALQKLNDDLGLTIVLCEHRLERVVQYADRVIYFPKPGATEQLAHSPDREATSLPGDPLVGSPREVLTKIDLAPPLVRLAKQLGWMPLPLTIKEGRRFSRVRDQGSGIGRQEDKETRRQGDERQASFALYPSAIDPSPIAITIQHLHVLYGEHEAVYDCSLAIPVGTVVALMGRNGSGKTTLLKTLVGLIKPQRGQISVLGRDVSKMAVEDLAGFIGYVPQDPRTLLFHDTLRAELEWTLRNQEPKTKNRESGTSIASRFSIFGSQIDATLATLGLGHLGEAYPRDLSGGEAQRAALGAMLVADPQVLLLDEPTRGLDYDAKDRLGRLLRDLAAAGRTIVLATHDVEMVAACADQVALLGDGELVLQGPVREVLSDSLIFSPQIAKLFPHTGWLTVEDVVQEQVMRAI